MKTYLLIDHDGELITVTAEHWSDMSEVIEERVWTLLAIRELDETGWQRAW